MRTLVTGGAGFAGSHLTEFLLRQGQEVTVLAAEHEDLANIRELLGHIRVERADLRHAPALSSLLRSWMPVRVYHLAALSSPSESVRNPGVTYEVNFLGTLNLLLACRELVNAPRFLFVSSSEVYGPVDAARLPLREDAPRRPTNPYAASKAAGELLAYQFFRSYGMPIVRVRPFNHTGPRQSPSFACSDFALQVAEIELGLRAPRIVVGNLNVQRDFSDVRDIVRAYHLLLEKGEAGEVYQLGSGRAVAVGDILRMLQSGCSKKIEIVVDPARLRPDESVTVWGDTSKAEEATGWHREYPLETTLRDLRIYWEHRLSAPQSTPTESPAL
ncbi:MAG: GDP-mannose 4,6-dehydratase [Acidobacteria bacterium]|nr:GDP-mannose 4,6-dehydratase [Acidobacteriota bacterium]